MFSTAHLHKCMPHLATFTWKPRLLCLAKFRVKFLSGPPLGLQRRVPRLFWICALIGLLMLVGKAAEIGPKCLSGSRCLSCLGCGIFDGWARWRGYINWEPKIFSLKLVTFRSWNVCFLKVSKDDVASSLCIFAKRPVYWGNISCQKSLSHPVARYSRPWPPCTCPVQGGWTGECLMRS